MEYNEKTAMIRDIGLQIVLILIFIFTFLGLHGIPQRLFAKLRIRNRASIKAKRHFVQGAQLLAQARSSKNRSRSSSNSLAKQAEAEAEKAIALDPKDAASYLLKAMALEIQGFRTSALESLEAALSPLAAGSLADGERGDALLKRAELKIATSQRGKVDSALADLTESVKLSPKNPKAWCLLGECYEGNKMEEEAKKAYKEALELEPNLSVAQEALSKLGSS
ncbi:Tetratricopeptide-like helical domain superfamily [Sesbania bispinosa]|nr:Tetratricopeptide-like helical domain superfamily [Sesbania bispinosa]